MQQNIREIPEQVEKNQKKKIEKTDILIMDNNTVINLDQTAKDIPTTDVYNRNGHISDIKVAIHGRKMLQDFREKLVESPDNSNLWYEISYIFYQFGYPELGKKYSEIYDHMDALDYPKFAKNKKILKDNIKKQTTLYKLSVNKNIDAIMRS